ncbi:MAG: PepSY-associated TM helix domain-containing protein [Alphaproteobacteria bacterium]
MSYRHVRSVHFWITAIAGIPLVLLSITGALLVFGTEIDELLEPGLHHVAVAGQPLGFAAILDRLAEQLPDLRAWSITAGTEADDAWTVWLAKGAGVVHFDPYTGTVLAHRPTHASFNGIITAFHRWWLSEGAARPIIRHAISATALLLMLQVIVGVWLWSIPPRPWKRLALRFRGRVGLMRLHQLTGLLTGLILMLMAFTGMSLHWHGPTKGLVEWASGSEIAEPPEPATEGLRPLSDLDVAVALGRSAAPELRLRYIRVPAAPGKPVVVTLGETPRSPPVEAWVGDDPPRLLAVYDRRHASIAEWFWHLRYWLHVGDFAGPAVRALWVIIALLPTAFVTTGILLHLGRRRRRRS